MILMGLFKYYSIEVNSGRWYWLSEHIRRHLHDFFFHFQYIIWSVLGSGWLVALRYADSGRRTIHFFIALAGLCLVSLIVADETRVLAIITFPLIAACWLFNQGFLTRISRSEISLLFVVWIIVPWGWVWYGVPQWSVFPYDITFLLHRLFGWFNVPVDPASWPFSYL
jgi:hypothetical protein